MVRIRAPPIAITPESSPWPATHLRQQHTGRGAPLRTTLAHDGSTGPLTMVSCLHLYTGVSSPVTGPAHVKVVHHSLVIQLLFPPLLPVRWCHNSRVRRLSVRGVRTRGVCRGLRSVHGCLHGRTQLRTNTMCTPRRTIAARQRPHHYARPCGTSAGVRLAGCENALAISPCVCASLPPHVSRGRRPHNVACTPPCLSSVSLSDRWCT